MKRVNKEIGIIEKQLTPLLNGNWTNDHLGKIEEMQSEINKLQELLLFTTSVLIHQGIIDIKTFDYHKDGWKIKGAGI
jgi:hypothetical protein